MEEPKKQWVDCPFTQSACKLGNCAWFDKSELKTEKGILKKNCCSMLSIAQGLQHCSACEIQASTKELHKIRDLLTDRLRRKDEE